MHDGCTKNGRQESNTSEHRTRSAPFIAVNLTSRFTSCAIETSEEYNRSNAQEGRSIRVFAVLAQLARRSGRYSLTLVTTRKYKHCTNHFAAAANKHGLFTINYT